MSSYRGTSEEFDAAYEIKRQLRDLRESIETRAPATGLTVVSVRDIRSGRIPPVPTGFTATPAAGLVTLTWNAVLVPNLSHYEVGISTNPAFADATTEFTTNTFWTYDQGTVGTTYYFRVRAVNSAGGRSVWTTALTAAPEQFTAAETPGLPGSVVLIDSVEFSSSASYDQSNILDPTTYAMYQIELIGLVPATDADELYARVYYGGTIRSSGYRRLSSDFNTAGNFYSRVAASGQNEWNFANPAGPVHGNQSGESLNGTLWLFASPELQSQSQNVHIHGQLYGTADDTRLTHWWTNGLQNNSVGGILSGIKFWFNGGNISSGRLRIYGWKTS